MWGTCSSEVLRAVLATVVEEPVDTEAHTQGNSSSECPGSLPEAGDITFLRSEVLMLKASKATFQSLLPYMTSRELSLSILNLNL